MADSRQISPKLVWKPHFGGKIPKHGQWSAYLRYRNGIETPEPVKGGSRRWERWPNLGEDAWDIVEFAEVKD